MSIQDKTVEVTVRAMVSGYPTYPMFPTRAGAGSFTEGVDGVVDYAEVKVIDGSVVLVKLEQQGLNPAVAMLQAAQLKDAPTWLRRLVDQLLPDGFAEMA